ncbi:MAG: hypothetical protein K8I82_31965 [Anaerolineae bacterium]|nr:hypothetical protein [Anaerolineae bacterium]
MTKKRATRSRQKASSRRQIVYTLLILLLALVVYIWGPDEEAEEEEAADTPATTVPLQTPTAQDWYSLYFTQVVNSDDDSAHHGSLVEQALIQSIDSAQSTIDGALFELNAPDTTAALVRALQRGVTVRLVVDDEHAFEDPESTIEEVIGAGAVVHNDARGALMHNKFLIIDGQEVWTGSMNLTRNDIYNNNNHFMLIRSPQMAQNYQAEFEEMFTDAVFNRRDDSRRPPNPSVNLNGTAIETYFAPEDGDAIESRLVQIIGTAQTSVRVMTFSFTLDAVGAALIDRLQNGVAVEAVFETTGSLQGQMPKLACAGANVRQDGNPDILHHKVFIIDEQTVVMGSFNFSNSARDDNNENLLIINNPDIAAAFLAEWQARFNEGRVPRAEDLKC